MGNLSRMSDGDGDSGGKKSKNFWDYSDKVVDFIDTKTFTYISIGLLFSGIILGVVAKYL